MNNAVYGKTMENVRKHRYIKLAKIEARRNQLVSEVNYHSQKFYRKIQQQQKLKGHKHQNCLTNKPSYLGLSILEISKIVLYEF